MSTEIMGIPLESLKDPIQSALKTYTEIGDNSLRFEIEEASNLVLTPEKPNSARSETEAYFKNEPIGKFYVIAFKPKDGTGSEANYKLKDLEVEAPYSKVVQIVPRNKTGVYNEGHLTIVTHRIDDVHAEPNLFDGSFDLLSLENKKITKIGILGHANSKTGQLPITTLTTGFRESVRFADPHSVFSSLPDSIQVCAFLAISEVIEQKYTNVLKSLNPQLPVGM